MTTSYEYWKLLDSLIDDLRQSNREEIANDLQKGKGYANGLTDGWFDHLYSLSETLKQHENQMTPRQKEILNELITSLKITLKRNN